MDLKLSAGHLDPHMEVLETDFAESASSAAVEQEPANARVVGLRHTSKSDELDYVVARLQAIGLNVGQG